jgi:hypothetical protein
MLRHTMSARHVAIPDGCLSCNPEQSQEYLDKLRALDIHVEPIPTPTNITPDVIVCSRCEQAWLLMPKGTSKLPT